MRAWWVTLVALVITGCAAPQAEQTTLPEAPPPATPSQPQTPAATAMSVVEADDHPPVVTTDEAPMTPAATKDPVLEPPPAEPNVAAQPEPKTEARPAAPTLQREHAYDADVAHPEETYSISIHDANWTHARLAVVFTPKAGTLLVQDNVVAKLLYPNGAVAARCDPPSPLNTRVACERLVNATPGVWTLSFDGVGPIHATALVEFVTE